MSDGLLTLFDLVSLGHHYYFLKDCTASAKLHTWIIFARMYLSLTTLTKHRPRESKTFFPVQEYNNRLIHFKPKWHFLSSIGNSHSSDH